MKPVSDNKFHFASTAHLIYSCYAHEEIRKNIKQGSDIKSEAYESLTVYNLYRNVR